MGETTVAKSVTVINPQGLHARPAHLFAELANRFDSRIEIVKDGQRADGKSILDILTLGVKPGTRLDIEATGRDARAAIDALVDLIRHGLPAEETLDQQETGENLQPG